MSGLLHDLRLAVRMLRSTPIVTALATARRASRIDPAEVLRES